MSKIKEYPIKMKTTTLLFSEKDFVSFHEVLKKQPDIMLESKTPDEEGFFQVEVSYKQAPALFFFGWAYGLALAAEAAKSPAP